MPSTFDRKRAKSYPSECPSEPAPLLELPRQEPEKDNEATENEAAVSSLFYWTLYFKFINLID